MAPTPLLATTVLELTTIVAGGYLIGCTPVAATIARRHGIDDLRRIGDHNPGYWNARTLLGTRAARPILVGDTFKGVGGALIGLVVATLAEGPWWWVPLGGGAAMVGHAFPVTAGFRGGRSVLAFVGTVLVSAPVAAAIALAVTGAARVATRRTDRSARLGVAAFPVVQLVVDGPERTLATGILMTFVGIRFATARLTGHLTGRGGSTV
jgi:glycerol-3-phosphate acyltransferase PlsY